MLWRERENKEIWKMSRKPNALQHLIFQAFQGMFPYFLLCRKYKVIGKNIRQERKYHYDKHKTNKREFRCPKKNYHS